jgi:hypothetical protein
MYKFIAVIACLFTLVLAKGQNVGIGTTNPTLTKLAVLNIDEANTFAITAINNATSGQRYGLSGDIAGPLGAAVFGRSLNGGAGSAGFENNHYGLMGITGATGVSVGGFTLQGTAIRGSASPGGLALYTSGGIRLDGIGEGANKVLISDASGNATWQVMPNPNHFGESWNGSTAGSGLNISNSNATGVGIRGYGDQTGVIGWSDGASGYGVLGINNSSLNYHPPSPNAGVVGVAGTGIGVYAAAVQGTSLLVDKANFGASAGIVAIIQNSKTGLTTPVLQVKGVSNQPVLELNNGFLQVAGTTRTAFRHTTGAGNISGNISYITYANPSSSDLLIVTHSYSPTNTYLNKSFGVYWDTIQSKWSVYLEDVSAMPSNIVFNVLVIKNP